MCKRIKNEKLTENSNGKLLHAEVRTEQFVCIAYNKDGSLPGMPTKHLHVSVFNCS